MQETKPLHKYRGVIKTNVIYAVADVVFFFVALFLGVVDFVVVFLRGVVVFFVLGEVVFFTVGVAVCVSTFSCVKVGIGVSTTGSGVDAVSNLMFSVTVVSTVGVVVFVPSVFFILGCAECFALNFLVASILLFLPIKNSCFV
tara:strand:- start:1113 stop:1541 length:429 start_codon:yes stop_codon:yes gene_type:complete